VFLVQEKLAFIQRERGCLGMKAEGDQGNLVNILLYLDFGRFNSRDCYGSLYRDDKSPFCWQTYLFFIITLIRAATGGGANLVLYQWVIWQLDTLHANNVWTMLFYLIKKQGWFVSSDQKPVIWASEWVNHWPCWNTRVTTRWF
jgi:hypothetical protein